MVLWGLITYKLFGRWWSQVRTGRKYTFQTQIYSSDHGWICSKLCIRRLSGILLMTVGYLTYWHVIQRNLLYFVLYFVHGFGYSFWIWFAVWPFQFPVIDVCLFFFCVLQIPRVRVLCWFLFFCCCTCLIWRPSQRRGVCWLISMDPILPAHLL